MTHRGFLLIAVAVAAVVQFTPAELRLPRLVSDAAAQPSDMPAPVSQRPRGYLGREGVPDEGAFLPPPPQPGSAFGAADFEVFHATRKLENSPRWQAAAHDAEIGQRTMFSHFACALGVDLSRAETPALAHVAGRAMSDLGVMIGAAKDRYQRPRPFITEEGPICVTYSEEFARSGSYPSGHSASGWLYALLFAAIEPEAASAILARGRAYGESRVVCGVHFVSDVEGGRTIASALVAALSGNAQFQADLVAARAEVAQIRAGGSLEPDAAHCATESAVLPTPW